MFPLWKMGNWWYCGLSVRVTLSPQTYSYPVSTATATATAASPTSRVPVFLSNVAQVRFVNKEPANIVRINGKRCVGLSVYKETSYNNVKAVDEINKSFVTIRKALAGYEFTTVQNQASFITNAIGE